MDFLLVEHAIVAAVFIWLINKAFSLGFQGTLLFSATHVSVFLI